MINYKKGITFSGVQSTVGIVVSIIGLLTMIGGGNFVLIGATITITGLILALSIKGTLVDLKGKRIKPYHNYLIFKLGTWQDLAGFDKIILTKFTESTRMTVGYVVSSDVHTKTYDIVLTGRNEPIILQEFTDYQKARIFLKKESLILQLPTKDEIQERRQSINIKPRRR